MKKLLSLILCVCMLITQFTFLAFAEDNETEPTNVAPYASVEVSSSYNAYTPSSSINDTSVSSNSTKWSPNTVQRDETLKGIDPWFILTFPEVKKVSEVTVIMALPNSNTCNLKFEAFVDGSFTEIGKSTFESSPTFADIAKAKEIKITLNEAVEATKIKVTFSNFTTWDPPSVYECIVMATSESSSKLPVGDPIDTSNHVNVAPEAIPSVFSNYNADSKPTYLNDDIIEGQINSYKQWRPQTVQRDPSVEGTDPWIKFKFSEYKEISKITILVDHGYTDENVVKYEALIQGEWIPLGIAKYSESPIYDESQDGVRAVTLEIPSGVTTKQLRMSFSGYTTWDPPMVCECMIMGAKGEAPEFDVPEGAYMTTNAALSGTASASSSKTNQYPALGNDDDIFTKWTSKEKTNNQWYQVDFDKEYMIGDVGINLSAIKLVEDSNENPVNEVYNYTVKIELKVNGAWVNVYQGDVSTSEGSNAIYRKTLTSPQKANAIKVTYLNTNGNEAMLPELYATISDGTKCMCIGSSVTQEQKLSAAAGNLACFGTPYASSVFTFSNISDVKYINDGMTGDNDYIWIPATPACPAYCGVTLDKVRSVDTVVLYFNDTFGIDQDGKNHVSKFDVQYKNAKGEYVTITTASSYDSKYGKAIISLSFDAVSTDDIRVVFKTNGGTFPYLKELEVYSHTADNKVVIPYPQFDGLLTVKRIPSATTEFKQYTVAKRPDRLGKLKKVPMNTAPVTNPKNSGWTGCK